MKNALLTGATGFLGHYILTALEARGYQVTILGRTSLNGRPFIEKDLAQYDNQWEIRENFDLVVHAAGKAHSVPGTDSEKKAFWDLNDRGTQNLLDALSRSNALPKTVIFISTVSVYGLESGTEITENTALNATDPYGASKQKAEEFIKWWGEQNQADWVILRLPLVAGKNPPGNLGSIINAIQKGRYFGIGNGKARKSMVMADDVANMIAKWDSASGIYHLTDGYHPTFRELEIAIQQIIGKQVPVNLPKSVAFPMALMSDLGQMITKKRLPFNSNVYKKMTQNLTFCDEKARHELDWHPSKVLDRMEEIL